MPAAAWAEWPRIVERAGTVVTADEVRAAVADRISRRDAATAEHVAGLELALGEVEAELDDAAARRAQRREDHDALLRWADWCEAQPAEAVEGVDAVAEATRTVDARSAEARRAGRALDDVLEQQATAGAALEEARMEVEAHSAPGLVESDVRQELERAERSLAAARTAEDQAEARRRIEVLHRTLAVRAEPRSRDGRHHEAVVALARQAEALEARLSEAVDTARRRADDAVRALAQAEQQLERLHQQERSRHRRLRDAVAALPSELRPRGRQDLLDQCDAIAEALRAHAESFGPELGELDATVDRLTERRDERQDELEAVRSTLGRVEDDDLVRSVRALIDTSPPPVVLDDPLAADEWPAVLADLSARPPAVRLLVLTGDPAVLDWAIDLPPSLGGVVMGAPAAIAESLQFGGRPADARGAAGPSDEPVITIDRLRAFAFRSPSESRSSDES